MLIECIEMICPTIHRRRRPYEPIKWVPVVYILVIILCLYVIYTACHAAPLLRDPATYTKGRDQLIVFNAVTFLMMTSFFRSVFTAPGEVPDTKEWTFSARDMLAGPPDESPSVGTIETKNTGMRRSCKWCSKYKPDRAHHCRVCTTCVLKMDHHCPWIYNCVGFHNHKYFFLLLFYACVNTHLISWTQMPSVSHVFTVESTFMRMFFLLFGVTLSSCLAVLVTGFLGFHIWLMCHGLTTIEFCEKRTKKRGFDSLAYHRGWGNICTVLGPRWYFWLLPLDPPVGTGITFGRPSADVERGCFCEEEPRSPKHSLEENDEDFQSPINTPFVKSDDEER